MNTQPIAHLEFLHRVLIYFAIVAFDLLEQHPFYANVVSVKKATESDLIGQARVSPYILLSDEIESSR